jgi:ABC-2 type transport system permease protein
MDNIKRILHIARLDLKIMIKDKMFFFWTLLFPVVLILIFGNLYRGGSRDVTAQLMVLNRDQGPWGAYFVEQLKSPGLTIQPIDREPGKAEEYIRCLVIPQDFSRKISGKEAQEVILKTREGANIEASTQAEVKIIQAIVKTLTEIILHPDSATFFEQRQPFKNILTIHTRFPEGTILDIPAGFDHVIPGTLVMFIMIMVLIYGGITVMIDRQKGVLQRILFSPASIPQLWTGKFLGRTLVGIVQALIIVAVGKLFFHLNLGSTLLSTTTIVLFCIAMSALSILLGSIFKKEQVIVGLAILLANIFAALGGCWWPIELVSGTMRSAAMVVPSYWAMDAFHQTIFFHRGFGSLLPNFLVLLGYTLVFSLISFKFFKIKE